MDVGGTGVDVAVGGHLQVVRPVVQKGHKGGGRSHWIIPVESVPLGEEHHAVKRTVDYGCVTVVLRSRRDVRPHTKGIDVPQPGDVVDDEQV